MQINDIVMGLPENPGVYKFIDKDLNIIYVGKAKNIKKRVSSYFTKNYQSHKVRVMVRNIVNIQFVVVDTESDAFLLENNLIKTLQPKYNILLKDDKTYPWICIKDESFPRVFFTRNYEKDGSKYFGPYTSHKLRSTLLDLIKQIFQLRTCNYNLNKEYINRQKYKVCLEYHLGNCKGPCVGKQSEEEYLNNIKLIIDILKGNVNLVKKNLFENMMQYSENMEFEVAQQYKEKLDLISKYQAKSMIVNSSINNIDVISIVSDEKYAYVNYMHIVEGAIVQSLSMDIKKKLDETEEEILQLVLTEIRNKYENNSKEIISSFFFELSDDVSVVVPKIGDKKNLLDLSLKNARALKIETELRKEKTGVEKSSKRKLLQMKEDLKIDKLPIHIECFDNSNLQGTFAVAAMVVFKNLKPAKSEYRHFNIKTVEGPNDYASMEEIIYRRYKRLIEEDKSLPQLIVIDGGKGQLASALKSLQELHIDDKISIISIAKRLEEIFKPNDIYPLYLDKRSETLKVIQQLRDEAHRFGIGHHRNKRSKESIYTELTNIKNIGTKTSEALLAKYKSVVAISSLSLEELTQDIGKVKAENVFNYFDKNRK
ncbi:MAG: excinuclease ABC subunit C [Bacteroidetes bacterium GWE2_29_8]|nr:MAG: excinuclease ABC subunit C [Bacteroidetes bacterium GWE2_29_8]OFY22566.1 MAG: excinuclease ABC subunit C [Bacteroidetes bacterium GWF2_29_10]